MVERLYNHVSELETELELPALVIYRIRGSAPDKSWNPIPKVGDILVCCREAKRIGHPSQFSDPRSVHWEGTRLVVG